MNYYEHHLGDYIESTAHLSMIEDGAYGRLMRKYYATERPLPADVKEVQRLMLCRTAAEREAVKRILDEYFILAEDGWHQERCDKEISRYHERTAKQKAISLMGVEARRTVNQRSTNGATVGQPTVNVRLTVGSTDGQPSRLQTPIPSHQSPEDLPTPTLPAEREGGPLENSQTSRGRGSNPRANGANPRAQGTNPRASRDERKSGWEAATQVWAELIASGGAKRDPHIQAALNAIGGWQRVRVRSDGEEVRLKREFCEAYVGATP